MLHFPLWRQILVKGRWFSCIFTWAKYSYNDNWLFSWQIVHNNSNIITIVLDQSHIAYTFSPLYRVRRKKKTLADHRLVTKCRKKKGSVFFYGATQTLPVFNFRAVPICAIKKTRSASPANYAKICKTAEILARRDPPKIVGSDRGFFLRREAL